MSTEDTIFALPAGIVNFLLNISIIFAYPIDEVFSFPTLLIFGLVLRSIDFHHINN